VGRTEELPWPAPPEEDALVLVGLDAAGEQHWATRIGGLRGGLPVHLSPRSDGALFVLAGLSEVARPNDGAYLFELSAAGVIAWTAWVQVSGAYDIAVMADGGPVVATFDGRDFLNPRALLFRFGEAGGAIPDCAWLVDYPLEATSTTVTVSPLGLTTEASEYRVVDLEVALNPGTLSCSRPCASTP
jgi:hypothetical protein